ILKLYVDDPGVARLLELDNDMREDGQHVADPPEFVNLRDAVAAKADEVRRRRTVRQPSEFTAADHETKQPSDETKTPQDETKSSESGQNETRDETPPEDAGDAYEGGQEE